MNKPSLSALLALLLLAGVATAGSLTPPGAPGSTMNTLAEIYDTIAGAFDSTGVVADQNGSLLEHLKYIEANMGSVGGGWTDDGTVVRLTTITDNVGIGTTDPADAALVVHGGILSNSASISPGSYNEFIGTYHDIATNWDDYSDRELRIQSNNSGGLYNQEIIFNGRVKSDLSGISQGSYGRYSAITFVHAGDIQFRVNPGAAGAGVNTDITHLTALIIKNTGNIGIGTSSPTTKLSIVASAGNYDILNVASSSGTSIMRITKSGNVGIGTTTPITQLHVPGRVPTSATGSVATGAFPQDIYIQGRYAYVINGTSRTLQIFDVSNPTSPVSVGSVGTTDFPRTLYVQGRYAYVGSFSNATLRIFDVSNPAAPVAVGGVSLSSAPNSVYVQGRYAYVSNWNSFSTAIVDVSNPSAPVTVGTIAARAYDVYVQGRYMYAVDAIGNTLSVIDVSNPASPVSVGSVATGTTPTGVFVQGRYAYVGNNATVGSLQIFDVSNPASPTSVGSLTTGVGGAFEVFVQGRYAYVANLTADTFQIIDVSNPASPVLVGSVPTGTDPYNVIVQGRYAYVQNSGSNTLQIFDMGGSYIQQFEAGGIEAGTLGLRNNLTVFNDANIGGGVVIGRGLQVTGPFSVTSSISGYKTFTINPNGTASISGTFGPTTTNAYDLGSSALRWRNLYVQNANFGGGASFSGNIDPATDNTYDLGEPARRWRALYLGPGSLHISSTTGTTGAGSNYTDGILAFSGASLSFGTSAVGTGSAGSLDLTTAGTSRVRITTAGNVGIGTTSPATKLEVRGSSVGGVQALLRLTHGGTIANDNVALEFLGAGGVLTVPAKIIGVAPGASDQELAFVTVNNGSSREKMRINDSGSIGIGTTAPTRTLDIFGSSSFDPFSVSSSSLSNLFIIKKSGNVGIGTTTTPNKLTVTGSASFSGSVGVGTTTPSAKLEVLGSSVGGVQALLRLINGGNIANDNAALEFLGAGGVLTVPAKIIGVAPGGFDQELAFTTVNFGSSREKMRIDDDGNVGIGTTAPTRTLDIFGSTSFDPFSVSSSSLSNLFIVKKSGNVGINTSIPTARLAVSGTASISGNVFMTGLSAANANDEFVCRDPVTGEITFGVTCTASSLRFKKNVEALNHGLDWVRQLRPVTFDWKHNGAPSLGFIAEEVNEVTPLLALYQDGEVYSVNYQIMTAVLAKAIQELDGKIENLATDGPISFDEQGLFERFVAYLRDAVLSVRGLVAETLETQEGVTTYDKETGQPYCMVVSDGEVVAQRGKCGAPVNPTPEPESTPAPSPEPIESPESTPEPSAEPTPEPQEIPEENGSSDEPFEEPAPDDPQPTPDSQPPSDETP